MEAVTALLDVETTALSLGGYSMSWLELVATLLYLVSVLLAIKPHIATWPTGMLANLALLSLFFQIQLYSDMLLQVYFLVISAYGWWAWRRPTDTDSVPISMMGGRARLILGAGSVIAIAMLAATASRLHLWLPGIFTSPAAFAGADASTTVLSIVATVLLARRKLESWVLWIVVDIVCVSLYSAKGVLLMACEHTVFLAMAVAGLHRWRTLLREQIDHQENATSG
jgi:nicotinamide mononucleotide transporter